MLAEGLYLDGVHVSIAVHSFVCDTPARAMVKSTKGHGGYFGCDKCETEGEWHGKVTFPDTDASRRTDVRFNEMANEEHHLGQSVFCDLPIGMVTCFPLDYMHLVCLGVMKRLLLCWLKGPPNTRLCARSVEKLSLMLINIGGCIPREFAKRPRSVVEVKRWKATEFRNFLLYFGPFVLRTILLDILYHHFLLLFVGITLLARPGSSWETIEYSNSLLVTFVQNAKTLYGNGMLVYNVHSLIHLADDVRRLGVLDNFSSFPFENALKNLKKLVRKPSQILQQIANRLSEQNSSHPLKQSEIFGCPVAKKEHSNGPLPFPNACGIKHMLNCKRVNFSSRLILEITVFLRQLAILFLYVTLYA